MVFSNSPSFAMKCLFWQYDQLMRSPLDGVNAAPLESNVFEWHGNFYFKEDHERFPGMVVHFILELPANYPNGMPSTHLLNPFTHSHVIRDTICFSLLAEWRWFFEGQPDTAFWNPARTIRSLLESVYIFFTVDEDKHIVVSKHSARTDLQRARTVCCGTCGHKPREGTVWPPEEAWMAALSASQLGDQVCPRHARGSSCCPKEASQEGGR
jgi:ubiquitin-protein ligase